ncbi:MAG TPA: porin, partial [Thauera sp.]|nr:porin [Thauera sp.]
MDNTTTRKGLRATGGKRLSLLTGALLALGMGPAHAVSFSQGDATLDINGTINGFYS